MLSGLERYVFIIIFLTFVDIDVFKQVVYQILLDWIQNKPLEAKVGTLFAVLWNAPEKDVVQRMANEYDKNKY